jgi:hypothetical protein
MGHRAIEIVACTMLFVGVTCIAHAQPSPILQHEAGGLVARTPEKDILWRVHPWVSDGPIGYEARDRGRILIDGSLLVDGTGRMLARASGRDHHVNRAVPTGTLAWDDPVEVGIGAPFDYEVDVPPLVGGSGETWVVLRGTTEVGDVIEVTRSMPHSGQWTIPEIVHETAGRVIAVVAAIDGSDRVVIVFRELSDGMNHLKALFYTPEAGWMDAETLHSTADFFQQVDVAMDQEGNAVAAVDLDNSMFAFVRDAATGNWGEPVRVSPPSLGTVEYPTLIANRGRTSLYALYWNEAGANAGIYLHRFASATRGWEAPKRVPGTTRAILPGGSGPASFIPATVDDAGVVTVPFYRKFFLSPEEKLWVLQAARLQAGVWDGPLTIMSHRDYEPLIVNFADADYGVTGDVMLTFKRTNKDPRRTTLVALHYDTAEVKWERPAMIYAETNGAEHATRIAYRSDDSALATYFSGNVDGLTSRVFSEDQWMPGTVMIPGNPFSLASETSVHDLDVIMLYDDEGGRAFTTWFGEIAQ